MLRGPASRQPPAPPTVKRWLKRNLPHPSKVLAHPSMGVFGDLLRDPNLWHLNRRSVSGAVALGLFLAFLPLIGQMALAALGAIRFRVNLPLAVSLTWISNPLTFAPIFYGVFVIGCLLLGHPVPPFDPDFWFDWHNWLGVFVEVMLGALVSATVLALAGWWLVQVLWRRNLRRQIALRRARIAATRAADGRDQREGPDG